MWDKIKGIIGAVAPAVASVIGTPIAGVAIKGLCDILGLKATAKPSEIETALKNASADVWLQLKKLESDTEIELKRLDIDQSKIDQMEMESARDREVKLAETGNRDYTPMLLALVIVIGFFGLLVTLIFIDISQTAKDTIDVMLGALAGGFITMLNYYYGSSRSSNDKNKILDRIIK